MLIDTRTFESRNDLRLYIGHDFIKLYRGFSLQLILRSGTQITYRQINNNYWWYSRRKTKAIPHVDIKIISKHLIEPIASVERRLIESSVKFQAYKEQIHYYKEIKYYREFHRKRKIIERRPKENSDKIQTENHHTHK